MFHDYIHFFLIVFPHLSLYYLSPAHPPLSLSLSAEWLVEMDVMRQVHAGREMEAVPWRSAAVNKVKNNQVTVDYGSLRACCSHGHGSRAAIHHFLLRNDFYTFKSALVSFATLQLFFVCLLSCLSRFSSSSYYYLFAFSQFDYSYESFLAFQPVTFCKCEFQVQCLGSHFPTVPMNIAAGLASNVDWLDPFDYFIAF